ncbi:MAG: TolC family protein [Pseudomonadota bacterium]
MSTNAQLELRRQNAKTAIAVLIGNSDPICEHFPKAFFFSKPDPSRDGFELEDLLVAAIANNPALQALAATSAQSRYLAERQSRERLPVIELVGIASLSANDFRTTTEPQYRVGIDVSVPIYAGSALVGRKRSASASAQGAQAAYQIERLELERRIRETVQSLLFLSAQIGHQIKVVASREDQFEAVTDEYRGGVSTLSVLVDARIDLEADSLALVRARFDRRRAHLSLLADLGLLVE